MTQIVLISASSNWYNELNKALSEFEQEYNVKPHMYVSNSFIYRCLELHQNVTWSWYEDKKGGMGKYKGYSFEVINDIDEGCVILKG